MIVVKFEKPPIKTIIKCISVGILLAWLSLLTYNQGYLIGNQKAIVNAVVQHSEIMQGMFQMQKMKATHVDPRELQEISRRMGPYPPESE